MTSGGYGHTVGKSLAMALVEPEAAGVGAELPPYRRRGASARRHRAFAL